jgi:hypothetical protein
LTSTELHHDSISFKVHIKCSPEIDGQECGYPSVDEDHIIVGDDGAGTLPSLSDKGPLLPPPFLRREDVRCAWRWRPLLWRRPHSVGDSNYLVGVRRRHGVIRKVIAPVNVLIRGQGRPLPCGGVEHRARHQDNAIVE